MNEESELTTFQHRRGSSNIDLTIVNKQLLKALQNWEISEEETRSYNIMKFGFTEDTHQSLNINTMDIRTL